MRPLRASRRLAHLVPFQSQRLQSQRLPSQRLPSQRLQSERVPLSRLCCSPTLRFHGFGTLRRSAQVTAWRGTLVRWPWCVNVDRPPVFLLRSTLAHILAHDRRSCRRYCPWFCLVTAAYCRQTRAMSESLSSLSRLSQTSCRMPALGRWRPQTRRIGFLPSPKALARQP
jgi:hypothetical protein